MANSGPHLSETTRRFRAARAYAGVEQKDAAAELGVSASTINRYERGFYPIPATWIEWAISRWGVPRWLLLEDEDDRGAQDGAARQLADFSQRELDQAERESRQEPGAGEGSP